VNGLGIEVEPVEPRLRPLERGGGQLRQGSIGVRTRRALLSGAC
jgi:hypothetical protein